MKITIERLGHQGDGIARGPVFVPMTLPGEEVEGELDGQTLTDVRILRPSTLRVKPPCRHFKSCGGCAVQHAADPFVAEWKAGIVTTALAAQGLTAPVTAVHTSPPSSRRRATLSGRRTKSGALVGFHGRASGVIVDIPDCQLLHPDLMASLPLLQKVTILGASRTTEIGLGITLTDNGIDLSVVGGKPLDAGLQRDIIALTAPELARITWNGEALAAFQPPQVQFGPARVILPPNAFLQATQQGEAALLSAVQQTVGNAKHVVDLFAGCGTFALPLAQKAEVHAVEGDAAMTAALDRGWRDAPGLHRVTHETRDLYRRPLLVSELNRYDAAVIDPPRAGAEAQIAELAQSTIARIAHVSCHPASFARDAKALVAAGYTLTDLQVIDQFRWSTHVELFAAFVRQ